MSVCFILKIWVKNDRLYKNVIQANIVNESYNNWYKTENTF